MMTPELQEALRKLKRHNFNTANLPSTREEPLWGEFRSHPYNLSFEELLALKNYSSSTIPRESYSSSVTPRRRGAVKVAAILALLTLGMIACLFGEEITLDGFSLDGPSLRSDSRRSSLKPSFPITTKMTRITTGHPRTVSPDAANTTAEDPTRVGATQCLLSLFEQMKESMLTRFKQSEPVLHNARFTGARQKTVQLFFSLQHIPPEERQRAKLFSRLHWMCRNDVTNSSKSTTLWPNDPRWKKMIMECPADTTSVYVPPSKEGEGMNLWYNTTGYMACDSVSSALFPSSPDPKLVSCTMTERSNIEIVPQFIEYYKLIGFDHVWIFYNDNWDQLHQECRHIVGYFNNPEVRQYASLIPHEWAPMESPLAPLYQPTTQDECMALGRRFNVDWMFLNDVDEYLQMMKPKVNLRQFLEQYQSNETVAGVQIKNMFFGAHPSQTTPDSPKPPKQLLLRDYQYRDEKPFAFKRTGAGREKVLVKPHKVVHFCIHQITLTDGKSEQVLVDPWEEMRHAHFKQPFMQHVGTERCRSRWKTDVPDQSLANAYLGDLEDRLGKVFPWQFSDTSTPDGDC